MKEWTTLVIAVVVALIPGLALANTAWEQRSRRARFRKDLDFWKELRDHPEAGPYIDLLIVDHAKELRGQEVQRRTRFLFHLSIWVVFAGLVVLLAGGVVRFGEGWWDFLKTLWRDQFAVLTAAGLSLLVYGWYLGGRFLSARQQAVTQEATDLESRRRSQPPPVPPVGVDN